MFRVRKQRPPLFWEPISDNPIAVKLSNMRTALSQGADPNELDGPQMPRWGRPLNYAILDAACINHESLKENLPVVELLLAAGADPRLSGIGGMERSPLEELRLWLEAFERRPEDFQWQEVEVSGMYEKAYEAMKRVAERLNGTCLWFLKVCRVDFELIIVAQS